MTLTEGLADLGSVLGALQKMSNIIKDWASFATDKERAAKIGEINGQILAAQTSAIQANAAQASLIEQIGTLKTELTRFETWDREKIRYELRHVGDGSFAYVLKQDTGDSEPTHWICPNCYENRKRSILQPAGPAAKSGQDAFRIKWACYICHTSINVSHNTSPGGKPL